MTKKSIIMNPMILSSGLIERVIFETDPYGIAMGVIRNIQKYCVILLTNKGTDRLHPLFGTRLSELPMMNISSNSDIRLFINDQVRSATSQFFSLQKEDNTLVPDDVLVSVELVSINISSTNKISIVLKFTPQTDDAVTLSIKV